MIHTQVRNLNHQIMQRFIILTIQTFFRITFHDIFFKVYIYQNKDKLFFNITGRHFIIFTDQFVHIDIFTDNPYYILLLQKAHARQRVKFPLPRSTPTIRQWYFRVCLHLSMFSQEKENLRRCATGRNHLTFFHNVRHYR